MFDQHMFLATRRHLTHKRKPYHFVHGGDAVSGQHLPEDDETSMEELSRTSFSSSSNSSFSVPDCNKSTQQEMLPFAQTSKSEKSFIVLPNIKNSNIDPCRLLDFRNVIKDSINRGFNASKSFNESDEKMHSNITLPTTLNWSESLEFSSPSSCSEFKEDYRFSHGRSEVPHRSIDANGSTCNSRLKPNLNNVEQSTNHKRSAGVIAKLMGLETMPQEPVSQNSNSLLQSVCKSRNLVENAPWKKNGKRHLRHDDKVFTHQEDSKGIRKVEDSAYKEIERKLIELEAVKSNRDLRALKQILDAMEEKGLLEPEKNDQNSYKTSPIVIMQPVNSAKRLNVSSSSRSSSTTHSLQSQTSFNKLSKKQPFNSRLREISEMKTSNNMVQRLDSLSPPRLQKEKLINEISHPSCSFPSTNNRRSGSGKLPDNAKDCQELLLLNKKKTEVKNSNLPRKEFSQRSEKDVPDKKLKKPSNKVSQEVQTNAKENTSGEQPSPVSVLDDSSVNQYSPKSPSNDNSTCYKYGEYQNKKSASRMKNMKKFENIQNLLQKLDDLSTSSNNCNSGGSTDHIASLSGIQNPNPNHRYISQILLASGILFQDTESQIQLHSSGYPINPDLFLVLEQTNACNNKNKNNNNGAEKEKLDRKLMFDLVNETLMKKAMGVNRSRGQQLIKDLCCEIDALIEVQSMALRNEDCREVVQKSKGWVNFKEVVPALVLEVERLIFKDLIVEVINDQVNCNSKLKSNVLNSFINQQ